MPSFANRGELMNFPHGQEEDGRPCQAQLSLPAHH